MEEELHEVATMQRFAGLLLAYGSVPDVMTILNLRRPFWSFTISLALFEAVTKHLQGAGLLLRQGTIVDATIIVAPSSTRTGTGQRDTETHQTKKGNQ